MRIILNNDFFYFFGTIFGSIFFHDWHGVIGSLWQWAKVFPYCLGRIVSISLNVLGQLRRDNSPNKGHEEMSNLKTIEKLVFGKTDGTVGIPSHRYVVSIRGGLKISHETLGSRPDAARYAIAQWFVSGDDTETMGVWHDCEMCYIDRNVSFDRFPTAIEFGRSHGQLAIYDTVADSCFDC